MSQRRSIAFLEMDGDESLDAKKIFIGLSDKVRRDLHSRFDHWVDCLIFDDYHHGNAVTLPQRVDERPSNLPSNITPSLPFLALPDAAPVRAEAGPDPISLDIPPRGRGVG